MTHARLIAYAPNGARLGVLPEPTTWSASTPHNDVSAMTLTYQGAAAGADLLANPVEVALEVATPSSGAGWTEVPNGRFIRMVRDGDATDPTATWSYQLPGYGHLLDGVPVLPATNPNDSNTDSEGKRKFLSMNAGQIIRTVLAEAQALDTQIARGLLIDFTNQTDSSGAPWAKVVTIYYEPGLSLATIVENLAAQGMIDWHLQGRTLRVFNPDTTLARDNTATRVHDRDASSAPIKGTLEGLRHKVLLRGEGGRIWQRDNPTAPAPWGKSVAVINQGGVVDEGTAATLIQSALDEGSRERVEYTRAVRLDVPAAAPYLDYRVGDYITARDVNGQWATLRVFQIGLALTDSGLAATLTLGDLFEDALVRQAKRTKGIVGGATADGGSGARPAPPAPTPRAPAAPSGLVVQTSHYYDDQGAAHAAIIAQFDPATTGDDGQPLTMASHELHARPTGTPQFRLLTSVAGSGNVIAYSPLPAGERWDFRVRAITDSGRQSAWSNIATVDLAADTTPPPPPSIPNLTTRLGTVTVAWDGKTNLGTDMPQDFDHCEVEITNRNTTPGRRNLVTNPSFETNLSGWVRYTQGIETYRAITDANPGPAFGDAYASLTGTTPAASPTLSRLFAPVDSEELAPGTWVAATARIGGASPGLYGALALVHVSSYALRSDLTYRQLTADRLDNPETTFTVVAQIPEGTPRVRPAVYFAGNIAGTANPPDGWTAHADGFIMCAAPTEAAALAAVASYFDGDVAPDDDTIVAWEGTPHNSVSTARPHVTSAGQLRALPGDDTLVLADLPYHEETEVRLVAVDTSGNRSEPSGSASITTQPLVDADLIDTQLKADLDAARTTINDLTTNVLPTLEDLAITADGRVTASTAAPTPADATGKANGSLWYQYTGNALVAAWRLVSGDWQPAPLDRTFIPAIDIGTGTFGDLTGARIAAHTITADALAVGHAHNLIPNGAGEFGQKGGWAPPDPRLRWSTASAPANLPGSFVCDPGTPTLTSSYDYFDVEPGATYRFEVWLGADKPNSHLYIEIRDQNGANAISGSAPIPGENSPGTGLYLVANLPVPANWTRYAQTITLSAAATKAYIGSVFFNHSNGTERNAAVWIAGMRLQRLTGSTLIANGAVVTDKIAANAVIASKIAANAVTAAKINANAVTADKINAGAVTAEKVAANAITAEKIAATAITAKHTITGATIQTTATANRGIKLTTAGISAYASNGTATFTVDAATGRVGLATSSGNERLTIGQSPGADNANPASTISFVGPHPRHRASLSAAYYEDGNGGFGMHAGTEGGGAAAISMGFGGEGLIASTDGWYYLGVFGPVSSEKSKKDIESVTLEYARNLLDVGAVKFRYTDPRAGGHLQLGVIAEQVHEKGLTEAVVYDKNDEPKSVDTMAMVALMLPLLTDHDRRLTELEERAAQ